MDTPSGRDEVPAAVDRLRGADRSGLNADGWAEVAEDRIGHPGDSDVPPAYYENSSDLPPDPDRRS